MHQYLEYEVRPGSNVPQGLPRQRLPVLSPFGGGPAPDMSIRWGGPHPGGLVWFRPGESCDLKIFWTRHELTAPAVALAIGGVPGCGDWGRLVPKKNSLPQGCRSWPWPTA